MIIVTGGAGFIGSNLIQGLNANGREDIVVVDDLTDGNKFRNLVDCRVHDYYDIEEFYDFINADLDLPFNIEIVFHQGACTDTTEWDGKYMMQANYTCSRDLLHYCIDRSIPYIYASSGSVYGTGRKFTEVLQNESPVNVYGYSKYLFDEYVRQVTKSAKSQIVGLRYFNVYGPREQHKKRMASIVLHLNQQLRENGKLRLFKGSGGFDDGEQRRDFIHVSDVINVNLWCMANPGVSGVMNVGTGKSCSFNDVAKSIIAWHGKGEIEYIDFPISLLNSYQSFTEADLTLLRKAGYKKPFMAIENGINQYLAWLNFDIN